MRYIVTLLALLAMLAGSFAGAVPIAHAAALSSLSTSTPKVVGSKNVIVTVKLASAAPSDGQIVALASSNTSLATVPTSVTIAAGKTYASVTVKTKPVATTQTVVISASYDGVTKSLTLTLVPATLSSLSVPATIVGGVKGTGTVRLTGAAPSTGLTVNLSASGGVATVPSSVTVASGRTSATFMISTSSVTAVTATTITATQGSVSKSATVSVVLPSVSSLSFYPTSIGDGISTKGTVKLNGPAPAGGVVVVLSAPAGAPITMPSSVDIAAGGTLATFTVVGQAVATATTVTVTATYNGSRTASLTVKPPSVYSVSASALSVAHDGSVTITVKLTSPAPSGGAEVALSVDKPALTVPASVTVPEGARSATFTATGASPAVQTTVRVYAAYGGTSRYASVVVKAAPAVAVELAEVAAVPNPATSGELVGVGVGLSAPAPDAGVAVTVTSSHESVLPVSGTYTITAGNDALLLFVTAGSVTEATVVTVTFTSGAQSLSVDVTVQPAVAAAGSEEPVADPAPQASPAADEAA